MCKLVWPGGSPVCVILLVARTWAFSSLAVVVSSFCGDTTLPVVVVAVILSGSRQDVYHGLLCSGIISVKRFQLKSRYSRTTSYDKAVVVVFFNVDSFVTRYRATRTATKKYY